MGHGMTDDNEPPVDDVRFPRRPYEPADVPPPVEIPESAYGPSQVVVPPAFDPASTGTPGLPPFPVEPGTPEAAYGGPPPGFGDPAPTFLGRLLARLRSLFAR
jgi:hypothetical protein